MTANAMSTWARIAKETSYGVAPAYVLTVSGSAGTYTLTFRGQTTSALAYNANASAIQTALQALSTVGSGNATVTGTGPFNISLAGYRTMIDITTNGGTGGATAAVTGGPTWVVLLPTKMDIPKYKTGVEVVKELRNAPWTKFANARVQGGAMSEWGMEAGIRTNQIGYFANLCGLNDVVTGAGPDYTHTMKPASASSNRKTYCLQVYDGLVVHCVRGLVGTQFELSGDGGEKGDSDVLAIKGWSCLAQPITDSITVTFPSDTTFVRVSPTTSGNTVTINGTATSLLLKYKFTWDWESKPYYTRTGTRDPFRPKYGEAGGKYEVTLVFDDATELNAAIAAAVAAKAWVITIMGTEDLGSGVYDRVILTLPAVLYTEPQPEDSDGNPELTISGELLYDSATAAPWSLAVRNAYASAYSA